MKQGSSGAVTVAANIDAKTFRRFALFDAFARQKRWRSPALFAAILAAFSAVCFAARGTRAQATLLGGVLLGVGLVLPLVWLGMFALSLRRSAKRLGLSAEKTQYTVALSPEKIHVSNDREEADFPWGAVHGAWRVKGCVYLYVSPTRAFLLPDGANTQRAWELIEQCAPKAIR